MNSIIGLIMAASIAATPMVAIPEQTTTTTWSWTSETETVYIKEKTEWPLGETVVEEYTMTIEDYNNR